MVVAYSKPIGDLSDFHANATVTDEVAESVKHGLAADFVLLARTIAIDSTEREIQKRLTGRNLGPEFASLGLIPALGFFDVIFARQRPDADTQHLLHWAGNLGEVSVPVLLPKPIGGELGQTAITGLALA